MDARMVMTRHETSALVRLVADAIWRVAMNPEMGTGRLLSEQQAEAALEVVRGGVPSPAATDAGVDVGCDLCGWETRSTAEGARAALLTHICTPDNEPSPAAITAAAQAMEDLEGVEDASYLELARAALVAARDAETQA